MKRQKRLISLSTLHHRSTGGGGERPKYPTPPHDQNKDKQTAQAVPAEDQLTPPNFTSILT